MKRTRTELFPRTITVRDYPGISAKIYRQTREKPGKTGKPQVYTSYTLAYSLLGKRKLEAFTDLAEAEDAARHAIKTLAEGYGAGVGRYEVNPERHRHNGRGRPMPLFVLGQQHFPKCSCMELEF